MNNNSYAGIRQFFTRLFCVYRIYLTAPPLGAYLGRSILDARGPKMEDGRVTSHNANSPAAAESKPAAEDVKSKILDRISKEVEKTKGDRSGQFQIVTGDPKAGETPVLATYYKGGSYVKTS
ncbi:hypothetical protein LB565_18700 [Mesorhizobium sp. CA14]|uniref:hypothetical protein n=1 Tax=Mesorhizobium sp. CA14 TaxID=2876642 RepID=UPI001CCC52A7|nr:hypothetical protein [Mesorhizobium sp. CA14]MBZ9850016.1 hypothetical protein [Mesorhizobium sp. CA14]